MMKLVTKYKQMLLYVLFGILTTCVNFSMYALFTRVFGLSLFVSNGISWFVSVLFAYLTNKYLVFQSVCNECVLIELCSFYMGRLFTGILDVGLLYILTHILYVSDLYIKFGVNILVIILNYIFGNLVFREK